MEAFFIQAQERQLFALLYRALGPSVGAVLYLHPFAEEMNKSRRMAALQARALAARGYTVLQLDLSGCGDSTGDFGDATWAGWQRDAHAALDWLRAHSPGPLLLWGLRTGASLAAALATAGADIARLILWQPVLAGDQFITQFLRIKLAGEMLGGEGSQNTKGLLATLSQGTAVEVGGYCLAPAMAHEFSAFKLAAQTPQCAVIYLEIRAEADALSPANQRLVEGWRASGTPVTAAVVNGEPFWVTQEITECPALLYATLAALDAGS